MFFKFLCDSNAGSSKENHGLITYCKKSLCGTRDALINQVEKLKTGIRAKVRYQGLKKNTTQLVTLFALSNLWIG